MSVVNFAALRILNSSRRIFEDPTQATAIDARLAQPDQNALIQAFSGMSLQHTELPLRPGWGTLGTPVKLRSNYFAVKVPRGPLHEYDVKLTPPVTIRRVKRRIFALLELSPAFAPYRGAVAHDFSAKLIAAKKLPQPAVFEVPFYDEDESGPPAQGGKTYSVEVTYIQDIDLGALMNYLTGDLQYRDIDIGPVLAALNIVLAQHPGRNGVMVGTNRFFFPNETFDLGGGLEAWKGFYSSVRPAYKQLMVNVNVATTAFYSEGNLANAMQAFRNASFGARVDNFVRSVRVQTTHLGHKKTVKRMSKKTARTHRFMWEEENRQITVEEYFRRSECSLLS